ncbi:hypothetical protein SAMN05660909_05501 [Chitinophaga terrae (ex Kim and Jung 2007)]|uniref:Uncharacterized protein n=1 Tax=Chitinophaga terrae (ex Kim and Jung 2007) TaxID=408074 RepID=A0A1H4GLU1_9BACT|nr:hypothetical protein [Chitinophaga terrae (ex Kim and Jung 2007)]GEP93591.1 hypothetical protein CTE07_52360 [Chitinophaga terrae (ex Kim and Jung 2007)]SEB10619.1 hypothetical protein SAMN05660909_05501 [Chitinophaga terrae (ex Kim and Jung 2007)]
MYANIFSLNYLLANTISLLILVIAVFWPAIARVLLSLVFMTAAFINAILAIRDPEIYMVYGRLAALPIYEKFIYGTFHNNIAIIVMSISICQMVTGIFLLSGKALLRWGLIAAVVFLAAIAPLGAGSAFPSTLLLAAAAMVLLFKRKYFSADPLVLRHHA